MLRDNPPWRSPPKTLYIRDVEGFHAQHHAGRARRKPGPFHHQSRLLLIDPEPHPQRGDRGGFHRSAGAGSTGGSSIHMTTMAGSFCATARTSVRSGVASMADTHPSAALYSLAGKHGATTAARRATAHPLEHTAATPNGAGQAPTAHHPRPPPHLWAIRFVPLGFAYLCP